MFENILVMYGPFVISLFSFAEHLVVWACPAMRLPKQILWK
jgi:hypothetical protein